MAAIWTTKEELTVAQEVRWWVAVGEHLGEATKAGQLTLEVRLALATAALEVTGMLGRMGLQELV